MKWFLQRRTSLLKKPMFWLVSFLVSIAEGEVSHSHSTLGVSATHLSYTCPEGATAKLMCSQAGSPLHSNHHLRHTWLFTSNSDQHCIYGKGPRNIQYVRHHDRVNHTSGEETQIGHDKHNFWIVLKNLTKADQGWYCCIAVEYIIKAKHAEIDQRDRSHIELKVITRTHGSQNCTFNDVTPPGGLVPVALAITGCILAVLSLPLILVLVYKQRQHAQSSRRGQELVRMDSEAQGHENPVFLGESPQIKTRTVSQIMTRQSSETGRHLLSESGTPLSPPTHGNVFFPANDAIPESPDFLQV
ncbi:V-type immunoglobulin domain-containing suppressor of T-cell activation [Pholidichthys leucotaenia]